MTIPSAALRFGPILVSIALGCSLLVDDEVASVRCSQSGRIGPPACDIGEICAKDRCLACAAREICDDAIDNDCDELVDDGCGEDGEGGAVAFPDPGMRGN